MCSSLIKEQLEVLRLEGDRHKRWKNVTTKDLSYDIVVSLDLFLPDGWSKYLINIRFNIPPGYPVNNPNGFWADTDLRLKNGGFPCGVSPYTNPDYLWFQLEPQAWNPKYDTLLTFVNLIRRRFWLVE